MTLSSQFSWIMQGRLSRLGHRRAPDHRRTTSTNPAVTAVMVHSCWFRWLGDGKQLTHAEQAGRDNLRSDDRHSWTHMASPLQRSAHVSRPTGWGVAAAGACLPRRRKLPPRPGDYEAEARVLWVEQSQAVMVALNGDGAVWAATTSSPMPCCPWAPCGQCAVNVVAGPLAGVKGLAPPLPALSLRRSRRLGFRSHAVQPGGEYQHRRIRCWKRNGFRTIGTPAWGLFATGNSRFTVGCYVMVQSLLESPAAMRAA